MFSEFVGAVLAYGKAFQTITRLRLWRYMLVPVLISLMLALLIGSLAWGLGDDLGRWLSEWYPWEGGKTWIAGIAHTLGVILIVALGILFYRQLVTALASPFMSPLSEKIERERMGSSMPVKFSARQFADDLARGMRIAMRNLIRELALTLLLFLLGLIPLFSPFSPILIFLVQSYYAGYGNMDYTMERHFRVRETVHFVRKHRGLALGNGIVFMGLLLTGLGFLIALPLGAVAATEETLKVIPKTGNRHSPMQQK